MRKSLIAACGLSLSVLVGCTPPPPLPSEEETVSAFLNQILGEPDLSDENGYVYVSSGSGAEQLAADLAATLDVAEQDGVISIQDLVPTVKYSEPTSEGEEPVLEESSLCFDASDYPDAARENFCFLFSEFEFVEGQLTGVEVAGEPIEGQILLNYFGRHALAQPEERLTAREFAAPGSNAEKYAIQQSNAVQASLDGGDFDSTVDEVVWQEDGFFSCRPAYKDPDVLFEDACSQYSDFTFEGNRLSDFNAGPSPLEGRILVWESEVFEIGDIGTFELLSAYESISGSLFITGEMVSATEELNLDTWETVYLVGGGRQIDNSYSDGPSQLKEGRRGYVSLIFSGGQIGGDLELNFYDENYDDVFMTIPIR